MTDRPSQRKQASSARRREVAAARSRTARRRDRFAARSALWQESTLKRVRRCGLGTNATVNAPTPEIRRRSKTLLNGSVVPGRVTPAGSEQMQRERVVGVKVSERGAGFSGVESCGSTWACPVCDEKIQAERQVEVAAALAVARARGWIVGFHTFTVRHSRRHPLRGVWGAVSTGWRAATSGSKWEWAQDRAEFGIVGYLRLTEVTYGAANGWHVHIHALVFMDPANASRPLGRAADRVKAVEALGRNMSGRWSDALTGTSFRPSRKHGHDSRLVTSAACLGEYFAKNLYGVKSIDSTAYDVTGSASKTARHGNTTPFGILARVTGHAELLPGEDGSQDLARWREWERESKGKRQLLWSNGLRAELGLNDDEKTDQTIVDEDRGGSTLVEFTPQAYRLLARAGLAVKVLEAAESGRHALELFLLDVRLPDPTFGRDERWIAFRWVDQADPDRVAASWAALGYEREELPATA